MKSRLYHTLGNDWPLRECRIMAEFLEYLKGESHFFAAVVMLENKDAAKKAEYLEQARGTGTLTPEAEAVRPKSVIELPVCHRRQRTHTPLTVSSPPRSRVVRPWS